MAQRNLNIKILIGLALVSEMCYLMIAAIPNLRLQIPLYLLCYGLVFIFYWIAAVLFCDFKRTARSGEEGTRWIKKIRRKLAEDKISSKELITVGLVFGVIFRLTLLFSAPSLSDDIYRYIWDGKVASQGINPYHYAPNAHELEPLRDTSIYPRINHKEISTIYPPVNQLVFWGLYKFDPSVLGFKAAFLGFDILTIVVLLLILKQLKINLNQALIYVWNPLIIVEIAGSGHADIIGILLLTLALWFLITNRPLRSNFTLVLSFLTKFISILFLPFFAMRKRENKFAFILLFIVFVTLLYLPYADAGKHLFSGLFVYADKWQANSSIFSLIKSSAKSLIPERWIIKLMIEPAGMSPDPETIASRGTDLALLVSKSIVTLIFTAIFLHFLIRFKKDLKKEGDFWIFKLG
ncbi:MAG: glycosyltransferase 87 family protein, partial [bacterium]